MTDLFQPEETAQLSPRLKWMQEPQVKTHYCAAFVGDGDPWCAWDSKNEYKGDGGVPYDPDACGYGQTEDEAIVEFARINNLRLWNET